MFYVYEWYNVDSGFIFYVGKGCNNRHKSTNHRNHLFVEYKANNNCASRIIANFSEEDKALEYEHLRIVELKTTGQATCNLDDGGKGGPQFIWTDEMRQYKSVYNPMKAAKQRKRMSERNPMKNPSVAQRVNSTKRRAIIINKVEYPSVSSAAKHFGVRQSTVIKWCNKGINQQHQLCRYKDSEQVVFDGIRYNRGGCRSLVYRGIKYETPKDLASELGLDKSTVSKWALRGFDPQGNECRYLDDIEQHEYKPFINGEKIRKPIYVNGVLYESKAEAERQLGLCKGYLAPYIAGTRKNSKYICEYANQQPNRGNAENSTTEGSTTNG